MAPPTNAQLRNQVAQLKRAKAARTRNTTALIPRSVRPNTNALTGQAVHGICSVSNPFCDEARGSKWPDGTSARTIAFPRRFRIPVTVDAAGKAGVLLNPANAKSSVEIIGQAPGHAPDCFIGTTSGNNIIFQVTAANAIPYLPILSSDFDQSRVVSCGFSFTPTLSLMDAQGTANFIEIGTLTSEVGATIVVDPNNLNMPTYITNPLRTDKSMFILSRPSGPQSRLFKERDEAVAATITAAGGEIKHNDITSNDWSAIVLYVDGAPPSTQVGYIEVYQHLEVTINLGAPTANAWAPVLTPPPMLNMKYQQASQAITRHNGFIGNATTVDNSFVAKARSYVAGAIDLGADAIDATHAAFSIIRGDSVGARNASKRIMNVE